MPAYEYNCPDCGPFTAIRPMAEFSQPQPCEGCGELAARALTAPALSGMDAQRRNAFATNERSANAPHRHSAGCGCGRPGKLKAEGVPGVKSSPSARPWMISH
jgi:putative FmdB family regulatory protein